MTTDRLRPPPLFPGGFTALVADSDSASRFMLRTLLENEGGRVIEAENGAAALVAFNKHRPDIVFLDTTRAETRGFDACTKLQALPHGPETPVLIVTAPGDETAVNLAMAVGASDYLSKPIHRLVLRQRIRRLLETHRTDAAILQAKKEWEAAFDAVSDLVILTDRNGKIIRCNRATIQALETTYRQLIGRHIADALFQGNEQEWDLPLGQAREMCMPALPGWFEVRAFQADVEGPLRGTVYVLKDISERKQLEENLQQSEQRFKALVENISEGIELFDKEGQVLYASPMVAHIIGAPHDENLVGANPMASVHPDDLERSMILFAELLQQPGKNITAELRTQKKDGSWIWVEASARNLLNEPGINAILVNFKDITERKQVEMKLRQLSQAVEQSPISIVITDTEGNIEYVNPRFTQLTGYSFGEVIGRNPCLLKSGETPPETYIEMWSVITSGHEWQGEFVNKKKNGEFFIERAFISPVVDVNGAITHFIALKEDISARKRAEEALRTSEANLSEALQVAKLAHWEYDVPNDEFIFNDHFYSIFRTTAREAGGYRMSSARYANKFCHPNDMAVVWTGIRKALDSTDRHYCDQLDHRILYADGQAGYISVRVNVDRDEQGQILRFYGANQDITDRKLAEETIKAEQQRTQTILETITLPMVISRTSDSTIVFANPAFAQFRGLALKDLVGRQTMDFFVNLEDWNRLAEVLECQGHASDFETQLRRPDGLPVWVLLSARVFNYQDEICVLTTLVDINERKRAEEALRLSEERFQLVTHATNDAVWDLNLSTGERWWNGGIRPLFGYKVSQIDQDQSWWEDRIHPEDHPKVLGSFQEVLVSGEQFWSKEYRFRRADGTYAFVFDRGYITQDEQGQPQRVIGAMMDISERKRIEEALRKSEEMFSKAFHASPTPMAITRVDDGVFIDVNGSWERLLGYTRETVIGQRTMDLNIFAKTPEQAIAEQMRTQGRVDNYEVKAKTKSGEERELLTSAQIVEIQGQVCSLSTFYDTTELRRMHEAMLASQKLADLGTLAAGVAHEMNSPLQVITGVSESLLKKASNGGVEPAQLQRNLDVIHRNGWRCAEIVRSLHTYARASGGSMQPTDLNDLVRDGLLLIEHQLKSWASITVVTDLQPDLPAFPCDHNQIIQVLINLLTNARDAMPQGGQITVGTGYDPQADELILVVKDTGTGIPHSVQAKIFDPFFTTKPLGKGTGLGLSITAGIVRAHSGTIEVNSTPGRGTTFSMRFPVQAVNLPASNQSDTSGRFDETISSLPATRQISTNLESNYDQDPTC